MAKKTSPRVQASQPTDLEILQAQIKRWRNDPELFFLEVLGKKITNQQREAAELVRDYIIAKFKVHHKVTLSDEVKRYWSVSISEAELFKKDGFSIHSGRGSGKDFFLGCISIWLMVCFGDNPIFPFKGLATATTAQQLEDVYSSEVKRLLAGSNGEIWRMIEVTRDGIFTKGMGAKREGNFITKRTAQKDAGDADHSVTVAGMHSFLMVLMGDEASGLPDGLIKTMVETCTDPVSFVILVGNVTRYSGFFYRTHYGTSAEKDRWVRLRWNCEESDLDEIRGGSGMAHHIERMLTYGRESAPYRVSVLGLPPLEDEDAFLRLDWIENAIDREIDPGEDEGIVIGVDPGRGGDKSAMMVRHGNAVIASRENNVRDTMVVADWVALAIEEFDPDVVCVDVIGLGAGVVDKLRRDGYTDIVREINVSENCAREERFRNLRAELYWRLREALENGTISIPNDDELKDELSIIRAKYWEPVLQLESKREMRARGVKSPNKADALMLTYFMRPGVTERVHKERDKYRDAMAKAEGETTENSWMAA
jgi:phage terminase large subunit